LGAAIVTKDEKILNYLFHIELIHGLPQEVLESVGSQRFVTAIECSVFEELGTPESAWNL
jgi:hypothetical protein